MMRKTLQILLLSSLLLLSACGGSGGSSDANTEDSKESNNSMDSSATTDDTTQSNTKKEEETTSNDETNSNDDAVARAAAKIDNLVIKVHDNSFQTKSKLYTALDSMLLDSTKIKESYTERMVEEMKLLNTLAKPFAIADAYSTYFTLNNNFNATTPAFIIEKALTNSYFLLSSESKFYLQGKTIKTYFKESATLATAWQRAITNADKEKNLYLALVEIDNEGKVTQVTNSLLIKSSTLKTY